MPASFLELITSWLQKRTSRLPGQLMLLACLPLNVEAQVNQAHVSTLVSRGSASTAAPLLCPLACPFMCPLGVPVAVPIGGQCTAAVAGKLAGCVDGVGNVQRRIVLEEANGLQMEADCPPQASLHPADVLHQVHSQATTSQAHIRAAVP